VGDPVPSSAISDATTGGLSVIVITGGSTGQVLTLQANGTYAPATVSSGSGDVVGPASATDNAIARFDTTTGKLLQNSGATISDVALLALSGAQGDGGVAIQVTNTNANSQRASIWVYYGGGTGSHCSFGGRDSSGALHAFDSWPSVAARTGSQAFIGMNAHTGTIVGSASLTLRAGLAVGVYTVGTLPAASSNAGVMAQVTDSSVATFRSTVAGGGSTRVLVFSDGTNWLVV